MKTKKHWDESGLDFTKFCSTAEEVDQEIYDYFLGTVLPIKRGPNFFMMGEPMRHNSKGDLTYLTFKCMMHTDGKVSYHYEGECSIKDVNQYL